MESRILKMHSVQIEMIGFWIRLESTVGTQYGNQYYYGKCKHLEN